MYLPLLSSLVFLKPSPLFFFRLYTRTPCFTVYFPCLLDPGFSVTPRHHPSKGCVAPLLTHPNPKLGCCVQHAMDSEEDEEESEQVVNEILDDILMKNSEKMADVPVSRVQVRLVPWLGRGVGRVILRLPVVCVHTLTHLCTYCARAPFPSPLCESRASCLYTMTAPHADLS